MKIKEFIEHLNKYPQDFDIFVKIAYNRHEMDSLVPKDGYLLIDIKGDANNEDNRRELKIK